MNSNHFKQGNQLLRENKLEEAIIAYKEAIKQNPNISVYYQNLGEALVKQDRFDEAIVNYRCAIELNNDSAYSYNALGEILTQKGAIQEAIDAYKMANKIVPNLPVFQENLSASLSKLKNQNIGDMSNILAVKITERSNSKLESYKSYLDSGDQLRRKGKIDKAIISYLQAIKVRPESYDSYIRLTDTLAYSRSDISANSLIKIIQICQDSIEQAKHIENLVYLLISRSFTELGEVKKAKEYYQKGAYQQTLKEKPNYAINHWHSGKLKGPDFIIIGAPKCGTTTLYYYLNQHPQVLPAIFKEIRYFNTKLSQQKSEYYFAHFPPTPDDKSFITGEANPSYLYDVYNRLNTAEHMYNMLPNIKLVVILRNPADRAISQYYHWQKLGLETNSLESVIELQIENLQGVSELNQEIYTRTNHGYLANGLYFFFLKQWLKVFPRKQILILRTEDFNKKPEIIMNQTFKFLGLNEYSIECNQRYNTGSYDVISSDMRRRLSQFFQPYNRQLEEYLDMEFGWD